MDSQQSATVATAEDKPGCASVNGSADRRHLPFRLKNGVVLNPGETKRVKASTWWHIAGWEFYAYGIDATCLGYMGSDWMLKRKNPPNNGLQR